MEIPTIMPRGEAFLISPCKLYKFASDIYRDTKNVNLKIDILNTNVYSKENISKQQDASRSELNNTSSKILVALPLLAK